MVLKNLFHLETRTVYSDHWSAALGEVPVQDGLRELADSAESILVKTHEMPLGDKYPAIYLVRDARDALVSYAHYALYTGSGVPVGSDREAFLRVLRELILSDGHFGGWSRNALAWKRRARTVWLRYEDLTRSPADLLHGALTAVGHEPLVQHDGPLPSFQDLHQAFPWFYRKGQGGSWRTEMPADLQERCWERHGEAMTEFGYLRSY